VCNSRNVLFAHLHTDSGASELCLAHRLWQLGKEVTSAHCVPCNLMSLLVLCAARCVNHELLNVHYSLQV
jgi:hypothetical protein